MSKSANQPVPGSGQQPNAWVRDSLIYTPVSNSGDWRVVNVPGLAGDLSNIKPDERPPATNVPEPGTLALLGIGLVGVGLMRCRTRN